MSGPLNRLVNRALGQGQSRLRPLTPGLFEPTQGAAPIQETLNEVHVERVGTARRSTGKVDAASPESSVPPSREDVPYKLQPTARIEPVPLADKNTKTPEAAVGEVTTHVLLPGSNETQRSTPVNPAVETKTADAEGVAIKPDPIEPEFVFDAKPRAPANPNAPVQEHQTYQFVTKATERLEVVPILHSATAVPSKPNAPAAQVSTEPDIHIHIGRLEVRTSSAQPATRPQRQKPQKRASASPPLSEYLKDRGG